MVRATNNEAVLIDFGLARNYSLDTTIRYSIAFTPNYAPPEQQYSDEDRWGPFVDVYALAATLYYVLTKTPPVTAISRIRGVPLKIPNQINPKISAGANQAILTGMELESRNRPSTIQEWLRLLGFEPVPTFSSPVFEFDVVTVNIQGQIIERRRKQAKYFTEKLSNGVTLEMVAIPGGRFTMGSPASEKGSFNDERPQHQVTIKPFFMGKYPVTQTQWRKVAALPKVNRDLKPNPSWFKGDNRPVEQISWYDAVEFCARLSNYTGRKYRLPSEAEWEYACRAGTTTPFCFGETLTRELANYDYDNAYEFAQGDVTVQKLIKGSPEILKVLLLRLGGTTPIGKFYAANSFGFYDMHGNVREWCEDTWHDSYEGAPTDGSAWIDNDNDNLLRLLRGGSWDLDPVNCRSAYRYSNSPDHDNIVIGFRVVCGPAQRTQ